MKKKFSWRAFISFGLVYAFLIIFVSGIVLYMSPPGRYAHWVNWEILGLKKEGWQAIHTIFSFTFVILSIFHLFTINWKAFLSYLKSKTQNGFNKKKEFFISTMFMVIFLFGVLFAIPPFQSVMDFGSYLTDSWEKAEEAPPIPHAELLTLSELAEQLNYPSVKTITRKLDNHNIQFSDTLQTLKEIAEINNTTPMAIYEEISRTTGTMRPGSGIGRKTITDFAQELGKSTDEIMKILETNKISATKDQTLRDIGDLNGIAPKDIYELISK